MGADMSAASLNPAGLALYRKSDIMLTPAFRILGTKSDYLGTTQDVSTSNFSLANVGMVFSIKTNKGKDTESQDGSNSGIKNFSIGVGYNQLENFYRETTAGGYNTYNSITDFFAEQANGIPEANLSQDTYAGMAYYAYAINPIPNSPTNEYFPSVYNGNIAQSIRIEEEGRINEWTISLAGNFDDLVFIGATLGIQSVRYQQTLRLKEEDTQNVHETYQEGPINFDFPTTELEFIDQFSTRGAGVNGVLGVIVRPHDSFRFGLSFRTPTVLVLTDRFDAQLTHEHTLGQSNIDPVITQEIQTSVYDFNVRTPYKATLGLMYLIKKFGFITADAEMVGFSGVKLGSEYLESDPAYYSFFDENDAINRYFKLAMNYRVGAEFRLQALRFRVGAALLGSALEEEARQYQDFNDISQVNISDNYRRVLTFGIGFRQPKYYIDASFVNQQQDTQIQPYNLSPDAVFIPTIVSSRSSNSVALSVGFKF